MARLKQIATDRPILFGFITTLILIAFVFVAGTVAAVVPMGEAAQHWVQAGVRIVATAFFLLVLSRFGWLRAAGVRWSGSVLTWLLALLALAYTVVMYLYVFFGEVRLGFPDPPLAVAVTADMLTVGALEEMAFRAVLLYALLRLWGDSERGIAMGVLVSAGFFGGVHLLNALLGQPLPQTICQAASSTMMGIFYAVLVLRGGSIWPAVLFHGLLNVFINLKVASLPDFAETVDRSAGSTILLLPVVALAGLLLDRIAPRPVVPEAD
jgi:membrane protease YdiL (CAAX protease family)